MRDIGDVLDRFMDDSPELRGQRLWVMFSLSVLLVAAMNAYAMVREPELIDIGDVIEYTNEVVSIEGTLISWVDDPYGSGESRMNLIIEDETGVIQLRWYRPGEVPVLGTKVTATGDVVEWDGRMWLQSLGPGALSWHESDVPDTPLIGISTIANNPEAFAGDSFIVNGYLTKAVAPDSSFTALYLGDHPNYANSDHQIRLIIHSAPGQQLEAGQKVEITAIIQYEQREARWALHVEGPEIRIVRTHVPESTEIGFDDISSWSYSSGNLVSLVGEINGTEIVGPDGYRACLRGTGDISEYEGERVEFKGRLLWSTTYVGWCIDAGLTGDIDLIDVNDAEDLLLQLAEDPVSTVGASHNTTYVISGFAYGSSQMETDKDTAIIVADGIYPNMGTKFDTIIPLGMYSGWIEDGQALVLNVSVNWISSSVEFHLFVNGVTLVGDPPQPQAFDWSKGAPEWYDIDKRMKITGNVVEIDNETYLQREGSQQRILIDPVFDSIGLDSIHENMTLTWTGRLVEVADDVNLAHRYLLQGADVADTDGDMLSDEAEIALGYDPTDEDSDDDGQSDRDEVENQG